MIFEKWNANFNISYLQEYLTKFVFPKEITRQSAAFGGWSVLSGNGNFRDGWQPAHLLIDNNVSNAQKKYVQNTINKKFDDYIVETNICTGYMAEVIETIRKKGLSPFRARIICLSANQSAMWHSDAPITQYAVRLHIPIITNSMCFFETKLEKQHASADGSAYFVYVNREHRVVNNGDCDRYHLVMNVIDRQQASEHHRYENFKG